MSDWKDAVLTWPRIGARGWLRVAWRGLALGIVTYGCPRGYLAARFWVRLGPMPA